MGMGGNSSHLFRVRLNPSTESSGHDWFPARDGMASALSMHPGFCCTEVTMQGFSRINSIPWERAAGNNAAPWCWHSGISSVARAHKAGVLQLPWEPSPQFSCC